MGTIIVALIVFGIAVLVVVFLLRQRKKGGACASCNGCSSADSCHRSQSDGSAA